MGIRIGIYGYGNLGKGVERAILKNPDMTLAAVFSRRSPSALGLQTDAVPVVSSEEAPRWADRVDVMIICGGSATDLPVMTPALARHFHVVDSFDTHAKIPEHFARVDAAAASSGHVGLISAGWDPGLFSVMRTYAAAILPDGKDYTFWGRGVSQGHSDAVRRLEGVLDARQYTIPVPEALDAVRSGETPTLSTRSRHRRECFVVAAEDADKSRIQREIVTMPNYFDEYDTTVHFITAGEMAQNHSGLPHGGFVIRTGKTGDNNANRHTIEFSLKLGSNPEFTSSVLVACARAVSRLAGEGKRGCFTMLDLSAAYLSPCDGAELRTRML